MSMSSRRARAGWLTAMALVFSWQSAASTEATQTLQSLVSNTPQILVGRVLRTELLTATVGKQTVDCGVSARIRVIDNVIGTTPEIITVGFQVSPLPGKSYLLPLLPTPQLATSDVRETQHRSDTDQARFLCQARWPTLSAQQAAVAEIVQVPQGPPESPVLVEWLQVPTAVAIPGGLRTEAYAPSSSQPNPASIEGQLQPASLRNGARMIEWAELRPTLCRRTAETLDARFCN